jgi:hypothetical protein
VFGEALEDLESCGQSELLRELEVWRLVCKPAGEGGGNVSEHTGVGAGGRLHTGEPCPRVRGAFMLSPGRPGCKGVFTICRAHCMNSPASGPERAEVHGTLALVNLRTCLASCVCPGNPCMHTCSVSSEHVSARVHVHALGSFGVCGCMHTCARAGVGMRVDTGDGGLRDARGHCNFG